jgi:hypothetical protein
MSSLHAIHKQPNTGEMFTTREIIPAPPELELVSKVTIISAP